MKTVYDYFREFADSLLLKNNEESRKNVTAGIKAFLSEMDICDEIDPEGKIANRELVRFRLMPAETFAAFFEHYEARAKILQLRMECELFAMNRFKNNTLISNEEKIRKLREFYELTTELAMDKRYSSWIDDMLNLIKMDLLFASGNSDIVRQDLVDGLLE